MKKATLFLTLSLLLIVGPAFGQNLVGTWCVYMSEAVSAQEPLGGPYAPGYFQESIPEPIEIEYQGDYTYGTLFRGYVDHGGGEYGYFSGVLDDKSNISITHWDSVTRGKLIKKGNKPLKIEFINNAFDAGNRGAKTAIGVAVQEECPLN